METISIEGEGEESIFKKKSCLCVVFLHFFFFSGKKIIVEVENLFKNLLGYKKERTLVFWSYFEKNREKKRKNGDRGRKKSSN